jgi:predicted PurR-regulated permease PerM
MFESQGVVEMLKGHWKEAGGFATTVLAKVSKSGFAIIAWALNLVIIPVAAFYLLRDWNIVVERIHALVPRSIEPVVTRLTRESDETLGGFLRGQLSVMIILGTFYGIGLWSVGISVGPLIGMIAGVISFVPYLGAIVGVGMGVIAAVAQYQDVYHVVLVLIVFVVGQLLEGYVLVPKLVGDKIGLHPVAVMFAKLAGGNCSALPVSCRPCRSPPWSWSCCVMPMSATRKARCIRKPRPNRSLSASMMPTIHRVRTW